MAYSLLISFQDEKIGIHPIIDGKGLNRGKWSGRGDLNSRLLGPEQCKRENVTH
jgi:hypothetical protein